MIESRHTLGYCPLCECDMVLCADCGNNCCNGGTGELPSGARCGCSEAYDHQDLHWKTSNGVVFAKDSREATKSSPKTKQIEQARAELERTGEPFNLSFLFRDSN